MRSAALAYLVAACLYAGFQVTVRVLVYPQMRLVPAGSWVRYELAHQNRTSVVVGPLFVGLVLAVGGLLLTDGLSVGAAGAVLLLVGLVAVTVFGAVPQHRVLSVVFDPAAHQRLLKWDLVRVLLAFGQVGLAAGLAR